MKTMMIIPIVVLGVTLAGCDANARIRAAGIRVERELQRELRYTRLARNGAPILHGQPTISEYVLTLKEPPVGDPYFFELKQYVITTGGDISKIPTASICAVMDEMFEQQTPLAEALKHARVELGLKAGPLGLTIGSSAEPVIELWYALRKFAEIQDSKVVIVVRGYADGQHSSWSDTLMGPPYDYQRIAVLPPVDTLSLNPVRFFFRDSVLFLPDHKYTNTLLPDLRAEFVRRELIMPFLERCGEFDTDVRVMKGFAYSDPDRPDQRKVQVYIYLMKK
jgi:hypothetical protein